MSDARESDPVVDGSSSGVAGHVGTIGEAATYLIYTFDAGQRIDTHAVAHRLLKAGVAETVYSAAMPDVRVAPRYVGLAGLLQRTSAVREFLTGPITVRAGLRLWLKYPRSGVSLLPLVWVFAKVRAKVWFYRRTAFMRAPAQHEAGDIGADDDSFDLVKMAEELIRQLEAVDAEVIESVARAQSVGAVQTAVDRRLLRLDYWRDEPFLRLGLRGSRHRFVVDPGEPPMSGTEPETADREDREPNGFAARAGAPHESRLTKDSTAEDTVDEWVDALALLHRTGVVQVMLRVPLPKNLTTAQLVGRVSSHAANIAASELPEPLLEQMQLTYVESDLLGKWQPEIVEGVRWRDIEFEEPMSFDDLFDLYFEAFEDAMPKLSPTWLCYPVLVVDGVTCGCSPDEWKVRHRHELAGVMFQHSDANRFTSGLIDEAIEDVSHLRDMVVLLNEARGVVIRWGDERAGSWVDDLHTLIPIEQALLQRGQLASLERRFAQAVSKPRHLERLEEAMINGLNEYRSSRINPGDARILVDRILQKSQSLVGYERLIDSVNQLHQKVTAAETRRSARQSNLLAFLAVLVAVALGLPAIKQSIEIANTVPDDSALASTAKPFVWLGEQGAAGVWGAFLVFVILPIGAWAFGALTRRTHHFGLRRRWAGRAWEIPLEVTIVDPSDAPPPT